MSKETCDIANCWSEASKWFECRSCAAEKMRKPVNFALCSKCAVHPPTCPHCKQACDEDNRNDSGSSAGSVTEIKEDQSTVQDTDCKGNGQTEPSGYIDAPKATEVNTKRLADLYTPTMKDVVEICVQGNTILQISVESNGSSVVDKVVLALEVGRRCVSSKNGTGDGEHKCCILAPTVPMVKERYDVGKVFKEEWGIRIDYVIGTQDVDKWSESNWQNVLNGIDILITTPQLFLDTLNAGHVKLSTFCVMIVEECQHCSGGHPFARLFEQYYAHMSSSELRVMGLSCCLVKQKLRTVDERQRAMKQMARLMQCQVLSLNNLVSQKYSKHDCSGDGTTESRLSLLVPCPE